MIVLPDLVAEDGSITSDGCGLIRASDLARICGLLDVSPETTGKYILPMQTTELLTPIHHP